ncbi:MAG: DUF6064 family protein, partial [Burkholderiaceae bacterium]
VALLHHRYWALQTACALLGVAWLWVALAFHWQRFSSINWAATWYAAAFVIEGLLLLAFGVFGARGCSPVQGRRCAVGLGLLLTALVLHPALAAIVGRPWRQAEVLGLAPDPTVLATLGLLLLLPTSRRSRLMLWPLWPIPLLWCAVTGMTLATMGAPEAWLMPAAAVLAVGAAGTLRLRGHSPP